VKASVDGNKLVLTDASGSTAQNMIVQDLGTTTTAADLGRRHHRRGRGVGTITGSTIYKLSTDTTLAKLNDGLGVRKASASADDVQVTTRDGNTYSINLANSRTIGDVAKEFDSTTGGKVQVSSTRPRRPDRHRHLDRWQRVLRHRQEQLQSRRGPRHPRAGAGRRRR
jgi:hypothetical protein